MKAEKVIQPQDKQACYLPYDFIELWIYRQEFLYFYCEVR